MKEYGVTVSERWRTLTFRKSRQPTACERRLAVENGIQDSHVTARSGI